MKKPKERKGKIIFINAVNEVKIERSNAWLESQHIKRINDTYWKFKDIDGFAKVVDNEIVLKENSNNLTIPLYVKSKAEDDSEYDIKMLVSEAKEKQKDINQSISKHFKQLEKRRTFKIII